MAVASLRCGGHLAGQHEAETLGDGLLGFGDLLAAAVVELQGAVHGAAHLQRHDDCGIHLGFRIGEANFFSGVEYVGFTLFDGVVCGGSADRAAHRVLKSLNAGVAQHLFAIGNGHGDGGGGGQQQIADLLRRLLVHAVLHVAQHAAGHHQHLF